MKSAIELVTETCDMLLTFRLSKLASFSFRASGNIGRNISIQLYSEILQNNEVYSNYSEYIEDSLRYFSANESPFIAAGLYTIDTDKIQSASHLILDPNYYIQDQVLLTCSMWVI